MMNAGLYVLTVLIYYFVCLFCRENCSVKMEEFLKRCFYHAGQYDSEAHFADLDKKLKQHEVFQNQPFLSNRTSIGYYTRYGKLAIFWLQHTKILCIFTKISLNTLNCELMAIC